MSVSTIRCETEETTYIKVVVHECTLGEFFHSISEETEEYAKSHEKSNEIDLFWHLSEYCREKYGVCTHQEISLLSILHSVKYRMDIEKIT